MLVHWPRSQYARHDIITFVDEVVFSLFFVGGELDSVGVVANNCIVCRDEHEHTFPVLFFADHAELCSKIDS